MNKQWYGFYGSDKYEILLYFSRFLLKAEQKVLVLDLSENKSVFYSVPNPDKLSEVDYRDVTFAVNLDSLDRANEYDYVLIDFGFKVNNKIFNQCEKIIFVTTQQIHHIEPMADFCHSYQWCEEQKKYLVIRDYLNSKVKAAFIAKKTGLTFSEDEIFTLYFDETDYGNRLLAQHNYTFKFKGSSDVKALLMELIDKENLNIKVLVKALKKAERGK